MTLTMGLGSVMAMPDTVLVARASGRSLGAFMRERIFEPLGMKDTAFHVAPEKISPLPAGPADSALPPTNV
jgi:CubicO group peptidase (beta-lactamase class C family)